MAEAKNIIEALIDRGPTQEETWDIKPRMPESTEGFHNILDWAGMLPGVGAGADALNLLGYAGEGDVPGMLWSGGSMIPGLGLGVGAIKKLRNMPFAKSHIKHHVVKYTGKAHDGINKYIKKNKESIANLKNLERIGKKVEAKKILDRKFVDDLLERNPLLRRDPGTGAFRLPDFKPTEAFKKPFRGPSRITKQSEEMLKKYEKMEGKLVKPSSGKGKAGLIGLLGLLGLLGKSDLKEKKVNEGADEATEVAKIAVLGAGGLGGTGGTLNDELIKVLRDQIGGGDTNYYEGETPIGQEDLENIFQGEEKINYPLHLSKRAPSWAK